ncbi:MAG: ATP synthase subunit I [Acidobacteriia bacterium]|nr:ATP synthase subunit I [Terriglobia bacterium]
MITIGQLYRYTALIAVLGFVWYFRLEGPRSAVAFLLGAGVSLGNLWLFDWLSRAIAPTGSPRKPWQAGAFLARYLILFTAGYVIVKALGVNPLAVVLGLFASTAAVLLSSAIELLHSILGKRRAQ